MMFCIEKEPLCETNLSTSMLNIVEEGRPTRVWMRCTVYYCNTGSWAPTLEWRLHEGNTDEEPTELHVTVSATVVICPNTNISSTLSILLNATSNSSYYSCKIYFKPENNIVEMMTANNTPDYIYVWKSPMVKVTSSPQWKDITTDGSVNRMSGMCKQRF